MKNYKKIDHFEPIAMKCTQEQFEEIRPILTKNNITISDVSGFKNCIYLTNNLQGHQNRVSNIVSYHKDSRGRTYYETFNAKTFLKACGIVENEPTTNVRNSVLLQLADNNSFSEELIRKEFPQLFLPTDIITIVEKYGKDCVISLIEKYESKN